MSAPLYSETCGHAGGAPAAPLVLLHGWGMNLRVFDTLRAALAERHVVTAIDLPGHGRSDWAQAQAAEQLLERVAACVPRGATLVGWSLGGQLALQLAAQRSLGVRRLVLIASTPRFVSGDDWPHGLHAATLRGFATQLEHDPRACIAEFLQLQVRGSHAAAAVHSLLQACLREHGEARAESLAAGLALLAHNDLRALARDLDMPVLLISGQYDRVTPATAAQALSQLLPQAQLLTLARAGHAPFLSHPQPVIAALHAFCGRPDVRSAAAAGTA